MGLQHAGARQTPTQQICSSAAAASRVRISARRGHADAAISVLHLRFHPLHLSFLGLN
jgi:hypothetical protein